MGVKVSGLRTCFPSVGKVLRRKQGRREGGGTGLQAEGSFILFDVCILECQPSEGGDQAFLVGSACVCVCWGGGVISLAAALHLLPGAPVTNSHKLGGMKPQKLIFSPFRRPKACN